MTRRIVTDFECWTGRGASDAGEQGVILAILEGDGTGCNYIFSLEQARELAADLVADVERGDPRNVKA